MEANFIWLGVALFGAVCVGAWIGYVCGYSEGRFYERHLDIWQHDKSATTKGQQQ